MKTSHVPLGGGDLQYRCVIKLLGKLKKISLVPDLMLKICIIDPHLFGGGTVNLVCSA